jgi:hypothetical protein
MHHYRCQNVNISATASEGIVDTLDFFPQNYQMPQLLSMDRLIMAPKDMTDDLQNLHPEVPFAHVGDATILELAELAVIFKLKLRQTSPPTLPAAPPLVKKRTCLDGSSNPMLASPMPPLHQTRSQTTIHTKDGTNAPLFPRVVTPRTLQPITSDGAHSLAEYRSPQIFSRQLLRHGHCPRGHPPRE